eukprot:6184396-Prymnesium_polylepis.1
MALSGERSTTSGEAAEPSAIPCRSKAAVSCAVVVGSMASKATTFCRAVATESCGKACRWRITLTCSRTENGYASSPSRTSSRSSSNARTS